MIAYLNGQLQAKNLRIAVVLVGGVGYRVSMPLSDLAMLGDIDSEVQVHVYTHVREDALELFGFLSADSMECFERLISVSGVGPKIALAALSASNAQDLIGMIARGEHAALTRIQGIGPKMAQRLVLELKDKVKSMSNPLWAFDGILNDLRSAISNLGYKPAQVERAIKFVEPLAKQKKPLSDLVREALREIQG